MGYTSTIIPSRLFNGETKYGYTRYFDYHFTGFRYVWKYLTKSQSGLMASNINKCASGVVPGLHSSMEIGV